MSYKFAHFGDIHWRGLSRHKEYKRAFQDAFSSLRKQNVDAIFIAGDIVHSKTQGISPELIDYLCWWFRGMAEIAPTYVTLGNHDGLIMNKDREDAISPIIRALNLPNLHLVKMTDKVSFDNKIDITNFSCFDEDNWENIGPTPQKINIALFHGAVRGSKTDIDWVMDGEVESSMFDGYDFVFLGDIHRHQYLDNDKRIAYCGSTVQQNFGETPDKGYLLWEINSKNDYKSEHIRVHHDRPFSTIDWKGTVSKTLDEAEQYPDFSRFRIKTSTAISQGEIKQLYSALKEFKNATEIVMKHESLKSDMILEGLDQEDTLNLHDPKAVAAMITSYYEKANLSDRMNSRLEELVSRLWKSAIKSDYTSGGRWSLKHLEFDNVFGYGKDNVINFDQCEGVIGIFGKNRVGKSSICGTIMYNLFNATDRGAISNLHVINSRKGHCKSKAIISKRGRNFLIERQSIKKQARSGKLSATTNLNLFEVDNNNNIIKDLCGEQRRETEKTLKEIVGEADDFLLTTFASQGEMNAFLKQKASARKSVLSKFLELDIFDRLNESAREESAGVKQLLKATPTRDFGIAIVDLKSKLRAREIDREAMWDNLESLRSKSRELELTLATRSDNNLVTQHDIDEQKEKITRLKVEKKKRSQKINELEQEFDELSSKVSKIEVFKSDFSVDNLKMLYEDQRDFENSSSLLKHTIDKERQKKRAHEKEVSKLDEVPCGDKFPTCQYIISAHKAKKEVQKQNIKIEELSDDLKILRKSLKKLVDKKLDEKIEKYNDLIAKYNEYTMQKSRIELSLSTEKSKFKNLCNEILNSDQSLDEMRANLSTDDAAVQIRSLRNKLRDYKNSISDKESKHATLSETVGLYQSNIQKLIEKKEEFESLNEQWRVFELFLQATSKNGIPLEVIRSRLPEINEEIASVLQGVTGFTVELESDEGSNEMSVYINYGDSQRIIECCSGMEKMMAALAIRVALINVSALPKSDILIIDEGFGSLDSANVEACGRFLESLKKWFKSIIIISHVDAIKDSVDNILEISRKGSDAQIKFT